MIKIYAFLADPDYCQWVDCKKSESVRLCPDTCNEATDPHWCKFADCTNTELMRKCKDTCRNKGIYFNQFALRKLFSII